MNDKVIETWKIELADLLYSYKQQRSSGRTGIVSNPNDIIKFVQELMDKEYHRGKHYGGIEGARQAIRNRRGY